MRRYTVAVVGATGLVGRMFLKVMEEYAFPVGELRLFASKMSEGKTLQFCGEDHTVRTLSDDSFKGVDIALFSAGSGVSERYVPLAKWSGALVVDNSSFWRMNDDVPLVVPEINFPDAIGHRVIANPNCSTIQAVLPLFYVAKKYGLKSVRYTTYQAVSGSGQKGISALKHALNGIFDGFYPADIASTCIPKIGDFTTMGYTAEEMKMTNETRKILHMESLPVSATCVRVPVPNCHAVCISAELGRPFTEDGVRDALEGQRGIVLTDGYPTSADADGKDDVYIGRLRRDLASENGILMYAVADNVRKGAAANAVQIALAAIRNGI